MVSRLKKEMRKAISNNLLAKKLIVDMLYLVRKKSFAPEVRCVKKYVPADKRKDKKYYKKLVKDVYACTVIDHFIPSEYFLFGLENRTEKERKKFLGYTERKEICDITPPEVWMKLSDKFQAYQLFQPFYKRAIIEVTKPEDKESFLRFCDQHKQFMVKVLRGSMGQGIYKVAVTPENDVHRLFDWILGLGTCVIEECICQSEEIAAFHKESVNTIRIVTYLKDKTVEKLFAVFRMGVGDTIVDNAGAGGIIAAIDIETGILSSCGYREDGQIYAEHPDTGKHIQGSQIPRWNELLAFVDELAYVLPEQPFVGWDLALTDDGWVMIEGNQYPSFTGIQMCTQKGIRSRIEEVFGR